jgi:peptide/histidine transporter 3/4
LNHVGLFVFLFCASIVNEAFERVASYGLMPNMIFYLMNNYRLEAANGSTILFLWSAMSNGLSIFLWSAILFFSFGLISIGAGCIRPCSNAFGADQLDNEENPNNESVLQSFFNWYYAATGLSTIIAFTVIVYIQDNLGWKVGFAVPAILMFLSALMFLMGSSQYIKVKASSSLFTGFVQVVVAAFRNRKLNLSHGSIEQYYHSDDSEFQVPTDNLRYTSVNTMMTRSFASMLDYPNHLSLTFLSTLCRCLNRTCIIIDPDRDVNLDGSASNPWRLCTVDQVESLKALLRSSPFGLQAS